MLAHRVVLRLRCTQPTDTLRPWDIGTMLWWRFDALRHMYMPSYSSIRLRPIYLHMPTATTIDPAPPRRRRSEDHSFIHGTRPGVTPESPYPVGTVSTNVFLSATTVLSRNHWPGTKRSLPTPLLGGSQVYRPLWVSSSSVSYMTFTWPWPHRTCET